MISSFCAAGKRSGLKRLWPAAALLVLAIALIALFYTCPSCNSDAVWLSLSLHPFSSASASLIAPDFTHIPKPFSSSPELGQQNKSVYQLEEPHLTIAPSQEQHKISPDSELGLEAANTSLNASIEKSPHVLEAVNSNQPDSDVQAGKPENVSHVEEVTAPLEHHAGVPEGHDNRSEEFAGVPEGHESHKALRTEQELLAAKQAIADAVLGADTGLHAPLYHNLTMFIKSYELMEKMFKIYTYTEGKPPLVHAGPTVGIYASEGRFIEQLQSSKQFVTRDPTKAHLFFLPYSVTNMVTKLYVPGSHSMKPLIRYITSYVDNITSKYTYWNLSHGADHFFVSCHDWGPATARKHLELRRNAIKVVCNADVTEEFVIGKDVSLPETYMHAAKPPTKLGGLPIRKRPYLAFFAGQMHGRVRPVLLDFWKDKDKDMKIFEKIPTSRATKKGAYVRFMRTSKFCICAMGYEVNSPRIVESIYYDCVPVIIADNFVLPFSEVLNWQAFSVSVAERDIPNLKQILLSVPTRKYATMQANLKHLRQHFSWHYRQPMKYDVFHMILHSLWLRRLASVSRSIT